MSIRVDKWGTAGDGSNVLLYTLSNGRISAAVSNYGALLVNLLVADKSGNVRDVVRGFDSLEQYMGDHPCFGATVGRYANRIGGASAVIDGVSYEFQRNDGVNCLHSGTDNWFDRMWDAQIMDDSDTPCVRFSLVSEDMDQGFPGRLEVCLSFSLTADDGLRIDYSAVSDKTTLFNPTNHSYFNLDGTQSTSVLEHTVTIRSDYFTPTDSGLIPTGELVPVAGTPMDFNTEKTIGQDIDADYEPVRLGCGFDHNWVLANEGRFEKVAVLRSAESGITMETWTDMPGLQMYASGTMHAQPGKNGMIYNEHSAVCFETQFFPDAVHHENFPSPLLEAGKRFESSTMYRFITE